MHAHILHQNDFTTPTLTRLLTQQRFVRQLCTCGMPGAVYADDASSPLCGRCAILRMGYSVESIDEAIRSNDDER